LHPLEKRRLFTAHTRSSSPAPCRPTHKLPSQSAPSLRATGFHVEWKLVDLAGRAVDTRELVEGILIRGRRRGCVGPTTAVSNCSKSSTTARSKAAVSASCRIKYTPSLQGKTGRKGDRHAREVRGLEDNGGHHCRDRCRDFGVHRSDVGAGATEFPRRTSPGWRRKRPGASPICRAFGPTRTTRLCSAPPNMPAKNSSPQRNAPNLTKRARQCSSTPTNRGRRGLRAMSPGLTIHSSCPSNAPARAPL
jgi:hypothetical protein